MVVSSPAVAGLPFYLVFSAATGILHCRCQVVIDCPPFFGIGTKARHGVSGFCHGVKHSPTALARQGSFLDLVLYQFTPPVLPIGEALETSQL